MKKKIILLIVILIIGVVTATTVYASTFINIKIDGTMNYDEANKVIDLVNKERSKVGSSNLTLDYELTKKAQIRAEEISIYFSHTRTDGSEVLKSMNLNGENIAVGYNSAEKVVEGWMNSDGHRKNILLKNHQSMGIASFKTVDGSIYWVQVFSWNKATSTKKFKGIKNVTGDSVKIKADYLKKLSIRDTSNKKIKVGDSYTIKNLLLQTTANSYFTTINNSNAKWSSSNTKIATISDGTIKGISAGEATITANINGIKTTWIIIVEDTDISPESISTNKQTLILKEGESEQLNITIKPDNATNKDLVWTVKNNEIVKVDTNGKVKALRSGSTTVEAKTTNNKTLTFNIIVESKEIQITKIVLKSSTNVLSIGDTFKVDALSYPQDATEKVNYKSSDTNIATIDSNGVIKAVGEGTVTITAYSKNVSETFNLTIKNKSITSNTGSNKQENTTKEIPVTDIKLNCEEITLKVGEKFHFEATVFPNNANIGNSVTWKGFNYKIGSLGLDNTLTAISAGEGIVTAYAGTANNLHSASCKVKIIPNNEIQSLTIEGGYKLTTNEARQLKAIVNPSSAAVYNDLTWSSSDPSIIKVANEKTGVIFTSDKTGSAVITVRASNGVSESITLTVKENY